MLKCWKLLPTAVLMCLLSLPMAGWGSSRTPVKKKTTAGQKASSGKGKKTVAKAPTTKRGKKAAVAAKGKKGVAKKKAPLSPKTQKLVSAFRETTELRPMAQQLAAQRSPAAYAGVQAYARAHPGEGASAAYLALGHAYAIDHRYPEAIAAYKTALTGDEALGDYADYLGAQAAIRANQLDVADALLNNFADRHPDSIFLASAPVLLATLYLQQGKSADALKVLEADAGDGHGEECRLPLCAGAGVPGGGADRSGGDAVPRNLCEAAVDERGAPGAPAATGDGARTDCSAAEGARGPVVRRKALRRGGG